MQSHSDGGRVASRWKDIGSHHHHPQHTHTHTHTHTLPIIPYQPQEVAVDATPQWGAAVAEMKVPSDENTDLKPTAAKPEVPYLPMGLNIHSNLLRLIRDRGKWGDGYLCPTTYSLHCHHPVSYTHLTLPTTRMV